ncbi:hypothetical protein PM082_005881 [Marasmius tenuissimus]|nr:hypothetical protein PM082_005881 [Marasmius tenuissimus]
MGPCPFNSKLKTLSAAGVYCVHICGCCMPPPSSLLLRKLNVQYRFELSGEARGVFLTSFLVDAHVAEIARP